uniref:Uncharacterized protein n=1 Tax=Lactuca sativa TaxID=4236 RepID=A0A9R1VN89_LACSA|nr:hypothetical protein LSAT_V11C500234970 [Lactuca sativa]
MVNVRSSKDGASPLSRSRSGAKTNTPATYCTGPSTRHSTFVEKEPIPLHCARTVERPPALLCTDIDSFFVPGPASQPFAGCTFFFISFGVPVAFSAGVSLSAVPSHSDWFTFTEDMLEDSASSERSSSTSGKSTASGGTSYASRSFGSSDSALHPVLLWPGGSDRRGFGLLYRGPPPIGQNSAFVARYISSPDQRRGPIRDQGGYHPGDGGPASKWRLAGAGGSSPR